MTADSVLPMGFRAEPLRGIAWKKGQPGGQGLDGILQEKVVFEDLHSVICYRCIANCSLARSP